jgi:Aminoacyl-tRNA editing domain
MIKLVIAIARSQLVMLELGAPDQVDLAKVAVLLSDSEVRLAHEEGFTPAFPDCDPGAMPPFGNLYGLPVYVDDPSPRAVASSSKLGPIATGSDWHTPTFSVLSSPWSRPSRAPSLRPRRVGERGKVSATSTPNPSSALPPPAATPSCAWSARGDVAIW